MISGTIEANQMKLCTEIVLLMTYQNTKQKFQKSHLWRHQDVITKNNGKIQSSAKPHKLYITRKVMMGVSGQTPPDKNPPDINPWKKPWTKPPCQNPRTKPRRQNILFRNFITFVFRMSYGKKSQFGFWQ